MARNRTSPIWLSIGSAHAGPRYLGAFTADGECERDGATFYGCGPGPTDAQSKTSFDWLDDCHQHRTRPPGCAWSTLPFRATFLAGAGTCAHGTT